jgi:hypothetical protein
LASLVSPSVQNGAFKAPHLPNLCVFPPFIVLLTWDPLVILLLFLPSQSAPSHPFPWHWLSAEPHSDRQTGTSRQQISPSQCSLPDTRAQGRGRSSPACWATKVAGGALLLHISGSWPGEPVARPLPFSPSPLPLPLRA